MTDGIAPGQDCTVSLLHSVTICNKKDGNNLMSSCCCCRALALPQSVISSIRTLSRAFTQHKHAHAEPVSAKSVWPESWPRNGRLPKIPATPDDPSAIRHLADVWPKGGFRLYLGRAIYALLFVVYSSLASWPAAACSSLSFCMHYAHWE